MKLNTPEQPDRGLTDCHQCLPPTLIQAPEEDGHGGRCDCKRCELSAILKRSDGTKTKCFEGVRLINNPAVLTCCPALGSRKIAVSPCGWFYTNSLFNNCRFRNSYRPICAEEHERKIKGNSLEKSISSSTLHGVDSINDLRSISPCPNDLRRHFLEIMAGGGRESESGNGEENEHEEEAQVNENPPQPEPFPQQTRQRRFQSSQNRRSSSGQVPPPKESIPIKSGDPVHAQNESLIKRNESRPSNVPSSPLRSESARRELTRPSSSMSPRERSSSEPGTPGLPSYIAPVGQRKRSAPPVNIFDNGPNAPSHPNYPESHQPIISGSRKPSRASTGQLAPFDSRSSRPESGRSNGPETSRGGPSQSLREGGPNRPSSEQPSRRGSRLGSIPQAADSYSTSDFEPPAPKSGRPSQLGSRLPSRPESRQANAPERSTPTRVDHPEPSQSESSVYPESDFEYSIVPGGRGPSSNQLEPGSGQRNPQGSQRHSPSDPQSRRPSEQLSNRDSGQPSVNDFPSSSVQTPSAPPRGGSRQPSGQRSPHESQGQSSSGASEGRSPSQYRSEHPSALNSGRPSKTSIPGDRISTPSRSEGPSQRNSQQLIPSQSRRPSEQPTGRDSKPTSGPGSRAPPSVRSSRPDLDRRDSRIRTPDSQQSLVPKSSAEELVARLLSAIPSTASQLGPSRKNSRVLQSPYRSPSQSNVPSHASTPSTGSQVFLHAEAIGLRKKSAPPPQQTSSYFPNPIENEPLEYREPSISESRRSFQPESEELSPNDSTRSSRPETGRQSPSESSGSYRSPSSSGYPIVPDYMVPSHMRIEEPNRGREDSRSSRPDSRHSSIPQSPSSNRARSPTDSRSRFPIAPENRNPSQMSSEQPSATDFRGPMPESSQPSLLEAFRESQPGHGRQSPSQGSSSYQSPSNSGQPSATESLSNLRPPSRRPSLLDSNSGMPESNRGSPQGSRRSSVPGSGYPSKPESGIGLGESRPQSPRRSSHPDSRQPSTFSESPISSRAQSPPNEDRRVPDGVQRRRSVQHQSRLSPIISSRALSEQPSANDLPSNSIQTPSAPPRGGSTQPYRQRSPPDSQRQSSSVPESWSPSQYRPEQPSTLNIGQPSRTNVSENRSPSQYRSEQPSRLDSERPSRINISESRSPSQYRSEQPSTLDYGQPSRTSVPGDRMSTPSLSEGPNREGSIRPSVPGSRGSRSEQPSPYETRRSSHPPLTNRDSEIPQNQVEPESSEPPPSDLSSLMSRAKNLVEQILSPFSSNVPSPNASNSQVPQSPSTSSMVRPPSRQSSVQDETPLTLLQSFGISPIPEIESTRDLKEGEVINEEGEVFTESVGVQTPRYSLTTIMGDLNDDERQRMFNCLARGEGPDPRDEELEKLTRRIRELEDMLRARDTRGPVQGRCFIETAVDFGPHMTPRNAETHLNYVLADPCDCCGPCQCCEGPLDCERLQDILCLVEKLESSAQHLMDLTEMEKLYILESLRYQVNRNVIGVEIENPVPATRSEEEYYRYTMDSICNFQPEVNNQMQNVNGDTMNVPSCVEARVTRESRTRRC